MKTAILLFIIILIALLVIAWAIWLALGIKQWWEARESEPPEMEIWSSTSDSLTK